MTESMDPKELVRIINDAMASIRPEAESVTDFINKSNVKQQEIDTRISKILEKL